METVIKDEYNKSVDSLVKRETDQLERKLGRLIATALADSNLDPISFNGVVFKFEHKLVTSFIGQDAYVSKLKAADWNASKFEEAVRFSIRATLDSMLMHSRTKKRRLRLFS